MLHPWQDHDIWSHALVERARRTVTITSNGDQLRAA